MKSTPEQRAQWRKYARRAAEKKKNRKAPTRIKDAVIYLRQARRQMTMSDVKNEINLLALMALNSLEKGD